MVRSAAVLLGSGVLLLAACSASEREPDPAAAATADVSFDAAVARLQAGDPEGAIGILQQVVEREPGNAWAWEVLGQVRRRQGEPARALEAFERAVSLDPARWQAKYGTAAILNRQGHPQRALDLLHEIRGAGKFDLSQITLDPDFADLRDRPEFKALLLRPEDFDPPFVDAARVIHEWRGEGENDEFGWVARNVGDVDGDGAADVATSAPSWSGPGESAGKIYVYSSRSGALLWSQEGAAGDRLGLSIEAARDVDGNGVPDVVASAPGGDRVRVYDGRNGRVLLELDAAHHDELFGRDVLGLGDVDGDGHGDILVGSPQNDAAGENAGRVAIYSGRNGAVLHQWLGESPGDRLGAAAAGLVSDRGTQLVLGAPDGGPGDRGRVYIYDGLSDTPKFVIDSDDKGSELGGMFVSVVGDVDRDGVLDVYASDWSHGELGSTTGKIVVHSGRDGRLLLAFTGQAAGDGFGIGPADAGDVDGDGHDDLVVGAWRHSSAAPLGGKVYLFSGNGGALLREITGRVMGDTFGFDATGMGDVDGDGRIDLLLTSAWSAVRGAKSGRVFLIGG